MLTWDEASCRKLFCSRPNALAELRIKLLRDKCELLDVINHQAAVECFEEQLVEEYSKENLDFYRQTAAYADLHKTSAAAEAIKESAIHIFDEYIPEGSPQQVNLIAGMVKKVTGRVQAEEFAPDLYEEAQAVVLDLMSKDVFRRFVKEERFLNLLDKMGSYTTGLRPTTLEEHLDDIDPKNQRISTM